ASPTVGRAGATRDHADGGVLARRPPGREVAGGGEPHLGTLELAGDERQVGTAPCRIPSTEDPAVDDADVEAAGLPDEGDLRAHRAAELSDVVALEERLDAVGR